LPVAIAAGVGLHQAGAFFSPRAPVSAPTSISISRSAANKIMSRRILASGIFSKSVPKFIVS
jgi:hypothetical protein